MRADRSERITAPAADSGEEARAQAMEELSRYVSQLNRYGLKKLVEFAADMSGVPFCTDTEGKIFSIQAAKREVQE